MTSAAEDLTIELPGGTLRARAHGPVAGPRVLALHGWLDNAATFDLLAPRLPSLRIVALDLPGHGWSDDAPAGYLYPFVDLVAAAFFASVELGWSRFGLLGHSLGASIASILAGTFPDRVHRLVLLEGLGPLVEDASSAPARLANALQRELEHRARQRAVYSSVGPIRERLMHATGLDAARAELLLERALSHDESGWHWRTDRRLRLPSRARFTEDQVLAFLGRIACPTLLVHATGGLALPAEQAAARARAVAHLRTVEVDGGHHVHLSDPDVVAHAIGSFLDPGMPP